MRGPHLHPGRAKSRHEDGDQRDASDDGEHDRIAQRIVGADVEQHPAQDVPADRGENERQREAERAAEQPREVPGGCELSGQVRRLSR
jgi:hypothetical protein